ncbi:hypothetical protein FOL47_002576, partial [Perkinsus chesapeaki]
MEAITTGSEVMAATNTSATVHDTKSSTISGDRAAMVTDDMGTALECSRRMTIRCLLFQSNNLLIEIGTGCSSSIITERTANVFRKAGLVLDAKPINRSFNLAAESLVAAYDELSTEEKDDIGCIEEVLEPPQLQQATYLPSDDPIVDTVFSGDWLCITVNERADKTKYFCADISVELNDWMSQVK